MRRLALWDFLFHIIIIIIIIITLHASLKQYLYTKSLMKYSYVENLCKEMQTILIYKVKLSRVW